MGLIRYLFLFLLPFSYGFPNRNSVQQSDKDLLPSEFSVLPSSKPLVDFRCATNQHFSFCSAQCQHNCANWGLPIPCTEGCLSGCVCDDGYVRGPRNYCILIKECSSNEKREEFDVYDLMAFTLFKCPEKEKYSWCNADCQSSCVTQKNPLPCSEECISGCVCNAGYVRDLNGKCIPAERCLILDDELPEEEEEADFCPPNEFFSPCLAHCQRNCTNWSDPSVPCLKICVPGCICDNGMVRGPYGNCIQPRKCPVGYGLQRVSGDILTDCPVDEHFDRCKAHCQKNCSNWDQEIKCTQICVSGCVCDESFVRGPHGKCVLAKKCSSVNQKPEINIEKKSLNSCPDGEQRSNLKSIQNSNVYCTSGNGVIEFCPPTYLNGCVCKKGQKRGIDSHHCIDRRLLPNANEIHFMRDDITQSVPSQRNSKLTEECFDLSESTEEFTSTDELPSVTPNVEINTQNNANDAIFTTVAQRTSAENLINTNADSHGCPNQQKCLEWCQKEGSLKGFCMGIGSLKLHCVCFRS